ncbi:hypothetical protein K450DRAFT_217711 [Umbelopsis ramanniana AG]|uniref:Uncharacterized protein n=1 Tax=Umbelopsis ramanniana AG TaxID=1314678 RepID=A0AAD5EJG4_UMBRA|nr:uncharacterized protein K450DRAFT_217711 [Umbelopsis ramanniana AG]KAI8584724.1 hypothetical protein K450DRAFT_217711 [Umbelopsis ramanniana AG]
MLETPHHKRDTVMWQARNGFIYETNHDRIVIVLEGIIQCRWEFPSSIFRVACCEDLNSDINAFVLTTDGVLYKLEASSTLVDGKIHEVERPAKRVKYTEESGMDFVVLSVRRDQVLADALAPTVWIQAYNMDDVPGCLIYHVDGSLIFWSIQGERTVVCSPVSADSNYVKPDDNVCQLYIPAGRLSETMHSNKKRVDGILFGIGNGNIYYKAVDETSEVCIMDHPDTLHSIHPILRPSMYSTGGDDIESVVILTLEGTATTVYTTETSYHPEIRVLCLTSSVTAAVSNIDRLYVLDNRNKLYQYTFLDKYDYSKGEKLVLVANTSNDPPVVDIGLFKCTAGYEPHETELLAVLADGSLTNLPISEKMPAYDEQSLQEQIQFTIEEIEKCRQSQTLLDETHQFLNSLLSEYNMTIHKLQRILDMKSKPKLKSDSKPAFTCHVKPKILPANLRSLVSIETLLSIELQTDISIRWGENWRLCIEMDPCSTAIGEPAASGSAPGELLMCPLDDLRTSVKWERDFAVNARLIGLPVYVNISLAFFPFLSNVEDQHENSIDGRILFPVHGIFLDMLCYAAPYPPLSKANSDFRGRKRTATDTIERSRTAVDIYGSAMKKPLGMVLPQSLLLKVRTSAAPRDTLCQLALFTLLSEGLDSQLLKEIMAEPEKAVFTLPLDRKLPVTITVRQQPQQASEQHHYLHILVECLHPFILLKAFQAITMRLSFNISEDMTDEIRNANVTLDQDILHLQHLLQSDQPDLVEAYNALSQHCQSLDLGTMVLEEKDTT